MGERMTAEDRTEQMAQEFLESFINGNLTWVARQLLHVRRRRALHIMGLLVEQLSPGNRRTLYRLVENVSKEER